MSGGRWGASEHSRSLATRARSPIGHAVVDHGPPRLFVLRLTFERADRRAGAIEISMRRASAATVKAGTSPLYASTRVADFTGVDLR